MKKTPVALTDGLSRLLANTYTLYLKAQNFHWNVTGPHFHSLHRMFEEIYTSLAEAVDLIAERIRSLGQKAPASFSEFSKLASIHEEIGHPSATDMVKRLLEDHEKMIALIATLFPIAQDTKDEATLDLLINRTEEHEKTAWMLRSTLE